MASIKARKKNSSILFINRVNTSKAGATGRVLSELTNHLAGQNWEVSILSAAADPNGAPGGAPAAVVARPAGCIPHGIFIPF